MARNCVTRELARRSGLWPARGRWFKGTVECKKDQSVFGLAFLNVGATGFRCAARNCVTRELARRSGLWPARGRWFKGTVECKKGQSFFGLAFLNVGATGFEPATSASRNAYSGIIEEYAGKHFTGLTICIDNPYTYANPPYDFSRFRLISPNLPIFTPY